MTDSAPPAADTEDVRFRGDGYVAEAGWFGAEDRPRFGWLYRPDVPAANGVGIVIVPPFGREDICAHRTLRHLAEDAAHAGFIALRFDLDGTGDGDGDDTDPDRIEAWLASIRDACELARGNGCRQLAVVGVRLGATLAAFAASKRNDVAALVAFNAIISGRAYLRELRALQMAMNLAPSPTASMEGGQETNGFLLNAQACEALKALDLVSLEPPAPAVWLLERDDMPERGEWAEHLRTSGCNVVCKRIPGFVQMMDAPHANRVASEFIGACIECASTVGSRAHAHPIPAESGLRRRIELIIGDERITEETVAPGTSMFGIHTKPSKRSTGRAVLMLNAGAIRHIGSNRMDVPLARQLATAGLEVLRADLTGIGDSPARTREPENIVYAPHAAADVGVLVEWLRERGAREISVGGMCSGAYHALRAALSWPAIDRIYMVNCGVFGAKVDFDPENNSLFGDIAHYNQAVKSAHAWCRLFTGKVALGSITPVITWHLRQHSMRLYRELFRFLHLPLHDDLGTHLLAMAGRGMHLDFLYSETDPGRALLTAEAGSVIPRLRRQGLCSMRVFEGADHTFTQRWAQAALSEALKAILIPVGKPAC
jgi:pimeloyl-ACP methyl ester carboxylesterase